jgi:hypothetical protein
MAAAAPLSAPGLWLTGAERWLLLTGLAVALGGLAGQHVHDTATAHLGHLVRYGQRGK